MISKVRKTYILFWIIYQNKIPLNSNAIERPPQHSSRKAWLLLTIRSYAAQYNCRRIPLAPSMRKNKNEYFNVCLVSRLLFMSSLLLKSFQTRCLPKK